MLLTLRGTPFLYYGEEIGMADGPIPPDRVIDVAGRDPERTPMPWTASGDEWSDPWLPLSDTSRNVEQQRDDPRSTLTFVRDLIARRKEFAGAPYRTLPSRRGVWAYSRGDVTCVINMTSRTADYEGRRLEAWEAAIL